MTVGLVSILAFGIACLGTYLLSRPNSPLRVLDYPNQRSLHSRPVPRTGGLAILAGIAGGVIAAVDVLGMRMELIWIGVAASIVGLVSFVDDWSHVPATVRFVAHVLAAVLLSVGGLHIESVLLPGVEISVSWGGGVFLSVLFLVWMTNLYNFMDGMDGFAGGMGLIGFGALSILGFSAGVTVFALVCAVIAVATAGFLVFNFPPAKIFMGDTGSSTLGFLAAACMLWGNREQIFPLWIGIIVFSPFVVDASVTLIRRGFAGEKLWLPHKQHYYQRVVLSGWGHRKTVLTEYVLMVGCAISAVVAMRIHSHIAQWAVMAFWFTAYTSIMLFIAHTERETKQRSWMSR